MQQPLDILKQYWRYDSFRPSQEEIIQAVLDKKDVLAILPTGGGKSICFQIPALAMPGICIVVSPLIALMKDQVRQLQEKGIKAIAITGGIPFKEVDTLLDNCIYGNYTFLYISPERLQQDLVKERIRQMPVNLIAVDEAHCISQWGNDFRPAYKKITLLRQLHPTTNIIALTASATKKVMTDITYELEFENSTVFQSSLTRDNISFKVIKTADKHYQLAHIIKKTNGPAIVYTRNRKATIEISRLLQQADISSTFFHGGIETREKEKRMQLWLDELVQVMVATNAFGMGIDKPNVRSVIHTQLPDSLESYFQEAGRAGRDGKPSIAVMLVNEADHTQVKDQFLKTLPTVAAIKQVYRHLCNYFQISYGEGQQTSYTFQFSDFCNTYKLSSLVTYNCLRSLDRESVIALSPQFEKITKIQFVASNNETLNYLDRNQKIDLIAKAILRTYGGIFDQELPINKQLISDKTLCDHHEIDQALRQLYSDGIISLNEQTTDSTITFLVPREDDRTINPIAKNTTLYQKIKKEQVQAVIDYVTNNNTCKAKQLLQYFGEHQDTDCGHCSVCEARFLKLNKTLKLQIKKAITSELTLPKNSKQLVALLPFQEAHIIEVLQLMTEKGMLAITYDNKYILHEQ
ncbi:ATP-dependent DNA helicase RecQ [Spongiivirga sp. MCCC 1A20706]|uniref:RecQ family ATP-dependent DNA helicase n=1 Tax=Spongiivirga sp. MCCC 1A20706 TaxID=3160963 RepID=UPI003977B6DE